MRKDIGKYKLALDLGSTSIGWAILRIREKEEADKNKMRGNHELLSLEAMGVRIYDDGRESKTKTPTAVARRGARGARRNRDRKKGRVKRLINKLVEVGLFPEQKKEQEEIQKLDPYYMRTKAIEQRIESFELGRALLHIVQRRGFKSNRKIDKNNDDTGPVKKAIEKLEQDMDRSGSRTLGEYLYKLDKGQPKRVRRPDNEYTLYPQRKMYEDEFDKIIQTQKEYHKELLSDDIVEEIKHIIFHQRDLRPTEIGYCTYEYASGERRAPLALPIVQEFRIYQEVANLEFRRSDKRTMTKEEKQKVVDLLLRKQKVTFKAIRKELKIDGDPLFNLESEARKDLEGNETNFYMSKSEAFGEEWYNFPSETCGEIVQKLLEEKDEDAMKEWLTSEHGLGLERAQHICNIRLKDGYGRVSEKAINRILPYLKEGHVISKAAELAGYKTDRFTGEIMHPLPYYGEILSHRVIGGTGKGSDIPEKRYGKINNPTVHIVMNQLRKLVNACVEEWGHPSAIAIELARDLRESPKDYKDVNAKNKKDNDRIDEELVKLGVSKNRENRMRYKIWEDLASDPTRRCCPFTGKTISANDIFSPMFEVEHLIPFSVSYDNGRGNKVLSDKAANQFKGDRTPYEAFSHSPSGYNWNEILARAENMRSNFKRSRFSEDARERLAGKDADIIARQLNDTRYLSRIAKEYLQYTCDPYKITPIPGGLTAMMREKWGLESNEIWEEKGKKNRADHRHHAIDAFVVGCTTRSILQRVSTEAKNQESKKLQNEQREGLIEKMPGPFEGYLSQVKEHFNKMVISHKSDTGGVKEAVRANKTIAQLHEETAYGLIDKNKSKGKSLYVTRKTISGMEKEKDIHQIADEKIRDRLLKRLYKIIVVSQIADEKIRDKLLYAVQDLSKSEFKQTFEREANKTWQNALKGLSKNEFKQALEEEANKTWQTKGRSNDSPVDTPPVRKVRIHIEKSDNVMIPIKDRKDGSEYKFYQGGGNLYADIFVSEHRDVKDKTTDKVKYKKGRWYAEVVTNYAAHQYAKNPDGIDCEWKKEAPMARRIMRVYKNDMVAYEEDGEKVICRVKKMSGDGRVYLIPHTIAKEEKDGDSTLGAPASTLQLKNARKIRVDILGKVWDPGP